MTNDTAAPVDTLREERGRMQRQLQSLLLDLPIMMDVSTLDITVEHGYEHDVRTHGAHLSLRSTDERPYLTLVLLHPLYCGCDALTNELVWHG